MQCGHVTICNDVIKGGAFDLQWKNQLHAHGMKPLHVQMGCHFGSFQTQLQSTICTL